MSKLLQLKGNYGGNERMFSGMGVPYPNGTGADMASIATTDTNPIYLPRTHLIIPASTGANTLVQLSATTLYFRKAYFYGLSALVNGVNGMASAYTPNTGTVYIGEMDPVTNHAYCIDPVVSGASAAMSDLAVPGGAFNFADFWVWIPTLGDGLVVKYQV